MLKHVNRACAVLLALCVITGSAHATSNLSSVVATLEYSAKNNRIKACFDTDDICLVLGDINTSVFNDNSTPSCSPKNVTKRMHDYFSPEALTWLDYNGPMDMKQFISGPDYAPPYSLTFLDCMGNTTLFYQGILCVQGKDTELTDYNHFIGCVRVTEFQLTRYRTKFRR